MSGQQNPSKPVGPQYNLQSERLPANMLSPLQLAQFTAATSGGYTPRPQMPLTAYAPQIPAAAASNSVSSNTTSIIMKSEQKVMDYLKKLDGQPFLRPPEAQPINLDNFKGLKFITLDNLIVATREVYDKVSGTYRWEMCESQAERCAKYIQDECANKRVFFIASGALGKEIVPKIHDLSQVYAIYIFCSDLGSHIPWGSSFSKVRIVCNDDDRYLLPQLAVDVAQANIDWGNALLKKGNRDKAKDKFNKALENLNGNFDRFKYHVRPDPAMTNEVNSKLEQCK